MTIFAGATWGGRLASLDTIDLVLQAGTLVKLVLLLLATFSIISWAVILFKWRELRRASRQSEAFLEVYHEGSLDAAYQVARELRASPLAALFLEGYRKRGQTSLAGPLSWAGRREQERLERGLPFLATTGSATPFIGLFGTVIGIINAFQGIGQAGMASLAVVAPGIAEALVATAAGLAAAIPATIFYNQFVSDVRRIAGYTEIFADELETDLKRIGSEAAAPARAAGR